MYVRFRSKPASYDTGRQAAPGCLIPFFLIYWAFTDNAFR